MRSLLGGWRPEGAGHAIGERPRAPRWGTRAAAARGPEHGSSAPDRRPARAGRGTAGRRAPRRPGRWPARRSCRSLGRCPKERPHDRVEGRQRVGQPRRVRPARVHRVDPDGRPLEPARPLADQRDLDALGPGVGAGARSTASWSTRGRRGRSRCMYCPPEVTAITRAPSPASSSGRRPVTRANGPTTMVANVDSMPSGLIERSWKIAPALSTMTSSLGSVDRICSTAPWTEAREDMSATMGRNRSSPCRSTSSSRSRVRRSFERPTNRSRAPRRARASVVARPRPDVGP